MNKFTIGQWTAQPNTLQICSESITIQLRPKQMQLLCLLVDHQGITLSRDTILEQIWPGRYGADEALSRTMSELRKALGESVDIKTIPKSGYCLLTEIESTATNIATPVAAPMEAGDNNNASDRGSNVSQPQWKIAIALTFISILAISIIYLYPKPHNTLESVTVAILPLNNFTDSTQTGLLADGLIEEITHQLARHPKISVASRTSAFYFRDSPIPVVDIGKKLSVSHVLEGSIRMTTNGYRITSQLIETVTGFHLWSKTFDTNETGLLGVQEQIAAEVRKLVGQTLAPQKAELSNALYETYLLGVQAVADFGPGNLQTGEAHFKAVLQEYPNFTPAKIGLATAIIAQLNWGQTNEDTGFLTAENLLNEVAAESQTNAEYYLARALLYSPKAIAKKNTNREKAREWFEKALEQDPNSSRVLEFYARYASKSKEHAAELNKKALNYDPYNPFLLYQVTVQETPRSRTDLMLNRAKDLIEKFPNSEHGYFLASEMYSRHNNHVEAYVNSYQCVKLQPQFMDCLATLISALVAAELYDQANEIVDWANVQAPSLVSEFSILKKAIKGDAKKVNQFMQEVNVERLNPVIANTALLWAMSYADLENLTEKQKTHYKQIASGSRWHQQLYHYHWQRYKDKDLSYIGELDKLIETLKAHIENNDQGHRWLLAALAMNGQIDDAFDFANTIPANHLVTNFSFGAYHPGHFHQSIADPFLMPLHDDPRWNEWVAKQAATQKAIRTKILAIQRDFPLSDLTF